LSWFRFGYEILLINQWDTIEDINCPISSNETISNICFKTGEDVLNSLDMSKVFNHYQINEKKE
jgi:hypothetical protein